MVFYKIRVSGYSFVKKPEISFKDLILNFFYSCSHGRYQEGGGDQLCLHCTLPGKDVDYITARISIPYQNACSMTGVHLVIKMV